MQEKGEDDIIEDLGEKCLLDVSSNAATFISLQTVYMDRLSNRVNDFSPCRLVRTAPFFLPLVHLYIGHFLLCCFCWLKWTANQSCFSPLSLLFPSATLRGRCPKCSPKKDMFAAD